MKLILEKTSLGLIIRWIEVYRLKRATAWISCSPADHKQVLYYVNIYVCSPTDEPRCDCDGKKIAISAASQWLHTVAHKQPNNRKIAPKAIHFITTIETE
jgi:hypothetical protein